MCSMSMCLHADVFAFMLPMCLHAMCLGREAGKGGEPAPDDDAFYGEYGTSSAKRAGGVRA